MIVVGAGIIGLSCAWRLAQRGIPVTVFDAGAAAREASWAGAGMLAPGGEVDAHSTLGEMALRSLAEYPGFVDELAAESGLPIDYRRPGAIELAFTEREAEGINARAARQASAGIPSEVCSHEGMLARFYPDEALVDPRHVTRALLAACRRRGVAIREHEAVVSVSEDGHAVRTARGEYSDDATVIAAGAWSGPLHPKLPHTAPVRGHLISYAMPPGTLGPILRHGHTYLLQRASGLLVAGSSTEAAGFNRAIDGNVVADIHARASNLLPVLRSFQPLESWNGLRPRIESDTPAIGRIPDTSVWMAFGHYRNGILLAPETARLIVESFC